MEKRHYRSIAVIFALLFSGIAYAQDKGPEMADLLRANGKIYVVVAVLMIIFIGIVVYLISIDRKANKLDKELKELNK